MKANSEPTVDVIIPCYKQAHFLGPAIDSVLGQTYPHVKALVVDDGSPDETPAVAARYGDRIRYIRTENAGVSAARNTGILATSGEFLLFLDADDYLHAEAIEKHIEAARVHPAAAVFHSGCRYVDEKDRELSRRDAESLGPDVYHRLLEGNPLPPVRVMVRRTALAGSGLFDPCLDGAEDWDMWLRLAVAGCQFVPVSGAIAAYREHSGGKSKNSERSWRVGLSVLRKHRARHGNCRLCRLSRQRGVRNVRRWCFYLLTEQMDQAVQNREQWAGLAMAARSRVVRTPSLTLLLMKELYRYVYRCAVSFTLLQTKSSSLSRECQG